MNRRLVLAVLPAALLGVAAAPSLAAPQSPAGKPITKTYAVTAPVPGGYASCDGAPTAQVDPFKAPAAGTLKVELTGFQGDWDLEVLQGAKVLGSSAALQPASPQVETVTLKLKKATAVDVNACNYTGGPTGTVKITFTYK